MSKSIADINPTALYSLNDSVDLELIPNIEGYASIYNRVTMPNPESGALNKERKAKKVSRILADRTTQNYIKSTHLGGPWTKINGKIMVQGKEIIAFRKLNNLL